MKNPYWYTRHAETPEQRVWINAGPLRNGHSLYYVHDTSKDLHVFSCKVAAEKYRWWYIQGEYIRLRLRESGKARNAVRASAT